MKEKKKIMILVSSVLLVMMVSGLVVYAYFTYMMSKENEITIANNTIQISEQFDPPDQQVIGENVFKKEVVITNTDRAPCYVRVYADFSDSFVRSRSYISDDDHAGTAVFYSASRQVDDSDGITTFPEHKNQSNDWYFIPEDNDTVLSGYYYYKRPLQVGESTTALFTFIKTVNNTEDDIDQYDILVYSESMQLTDINGTGYQDYQAAWTDYLT